MSEECIFCRIVHKKASASVVYEDEQALAFMDIRPVYEGHTLIIPKQHYVDLFDAPAELVGYLHKVAKRVAAAAKEFTKADGVSIIQQNGRAAGQDIFHLHIHVIPRFEGQAMQHFARSNVASTETLDRVAAEIRKRL